MAQSGFTPILTYASNTATAVPAAGNLTNSANGAELAVNTADKRLFTKDSGGSVVELGTNPSALTLAGLTASTALALNSSKVVVSVTNTGTGNNVLSASPTLTGTVDAAALTLSSNLTLNAGTANGVAYLNASKVLTSGSALVYDGTILRVNGSTSSGLRLASSSGASNGFNIYNDSTSDLAYLMNFYNGSMIFGVNNTEQMRLTSTGLGIGTSSPATRVHAYSGTAMAQMTVDGVGAIKTGINFANGGTTYGQIYFDNNSPYDMSVFQQYSTGSLRFGTNNTERARITSGGNFLINNTYTTASKFIVAGDGTSNAAYAGIFADSAGASLLSMRNDGYIDTGTRAASPYNNTTASAANLFVDSAGGLYRSTSSLKYKTDVQDATHGLAEVMALRPVTYKGKTDGDTIFGGLIAEEVHAAGLTEFVQYAEDGSPDALAYGNMVSVLVKAIQEQQALIQQLTARVAALEAQP